MSTCDRPIRDRSGEELPGVRCNLGKGHLGRCCQVDWPETADVETSAVVFDCEASRYRTNCGPNDAPQFAEYGAPVAPSEPNG